jgi:hypothetical protein
MKSIYFTNSCRAGNHFPSPKQSALEPIVVNHRYFIAAILPGNPRFWLRIQREPFATYEAALEKVKELEPKMSWPLGIQIEHAS